VSKDTINHALKNASSDGNKSCNIKMRNDVNTNIENFLENYEKEYVTFYKETQSKALDAILEEGNK
jgi:hypothetical protein